MLADASEQLFQQRDPVVGERFRRGKRLLLRQRREGGVGHLGRACRGRAAGRRGHRRLELFGGLEIGAGRRLRQRAQLVEALLEQLVARVGRHRAGVGRGRVVEAAGAGVHLALLGVAECSRPGDRLLRLGPPAADQLAGLQQRAHRFHPLPDPLVVGLLGEVGLEMLQRDEQLAAPDSPLGALLHFRRRHRVGNVPKKGTCAAKATSTGKEIWGQHTDLGIWGQHTDLRMSQDLRNPLWRSVCSSEI